MEKNLQANEIRLWKVTEKMRQSQLQYWRDRNQRFDIRIRSYLYIENANLQKSCYVNDKIKLFKKDQKVILKLENKVKQLRKDKQSRTNKYKKSI